VRLAAVAVSLISGGRELALLLAEGTEVELTREVLCSRLALGNLEASGGSAGGLGGDLEESCATAAHYALQVKIGWLELANQVSYAPFGGMLRPSAARQMALPFAELKLRACAPAEPQRPGGAPLVVAEMLCSLGDLDLALDARSAAEILCAAADVVAALISLSPGAPSALFATGAGLPRRVRSEEEVLADTLAAAAVAAARADRQLIVRSLLVRALRVHLTVRSSAAGVAALVAASDRLRGSGAVHGLPRGLAFAAEGSSGPIASLAGSLLCAVLSLTRAPLALSALGLSGFSGTAAQLRALVSAHYARCVEEQLPTLLGSADVLGNPRQLLLRLERGLNDALGDGPSADGGLSLLANAVTGVSLSASLVTSSLANGVAELGFGRSEAASRSDALAVRGPVRSAGQGISMAVESVAQGALTGLTGLMLQPMSGAQRDGFGGFARGLFSGVTGAIARPLVGAIDAASLVAEGLAASSATSQDDELQVFSALQRRARLPRAFGAHGEVVPYSQATALFAAALEQLRTSRGDARFQHDRLVGHAAGVLVTTCHLIGIDQATLGTRWHLPLSLLAFAEVRGCELLLHLSRGQSSRTIRCGGDQANALRALVAQAIALQNVHHS